MDILCLDGEWEVNLKGAESRRVFLPGTLDENHIGKKDNSDDACEKQKEILTRLTRRYVFEGAAVYKKRIPWKPLKDKRVFLEIERSRELYVSCNGLPAAVTEPPTLSTPGIFEITELLSEGENVLSVTCDNSYPSWPHDAILYSSAATDETQTNWNGLLGKLFIKTENKNFIANLRCYPAMKTVDFVLEMNCAEEYVGIVRICSPALKNAVEIPVCVPAGISEINLRDLALSKEVSYWNESEGNLYEVICSGDGLEEKRFHFGVRVFDSADGKLCLNKRRFFLRGETNCCVFPETGHMPMETDAWRIILQTYKSYGVNCIRFHSHCPPEAAFRAADESGILLQPELSHWNPKNAFEDEMSWNYYKMELLQILKFYANHPSFVMLTFGNELHAGSLGHERMDILLKEARNYDRTRLFACGSNVHYGMMGADPSSDFYTSSDYFKNQIRGTSRAMTGYINQCYPGTEKNFDDELKAIRKEYDKPVFSFEVGQYEILPDLGEIKAFCGVTIPDNYSLAQKNVKEKGMEKVWRGFVEATGEMSLLAYREEVEAVRRTDAMSGISLLSLQDFPGQGTALVGMLNAHLQPKPFSFSSPDRFRMFFGEAALLVTLKKYTYTCGETIRVGIQMSNYGKKDLQGDCIVQLKDSVENDSGKVAVKEILEDRNCPAGQLTELGSVVFTAGVCDKARRYYISARLGSVYSEYPVWIYPDEKVLCLADVCIVRSVAEAVNGVKDGKTVLLDPPATQDYFPNSIKTQFTTNFWSVGTFPEEEGFMGIHPDPRHPALWDFPTESYTNWQWWPMCEGRAMILPEKIHPILPGMDCFARMRNLGLLIEVELANGRLMVSSMGLLDHTQYPEVRSLINSLQRYLSKEPVSRLEIVTEEELKGIVWDPA